jgi:hypothetical protein
MIPTPINLCINLHAHPHAHHLTPFLTPQNPMPKLKPQTSVFEKKYQNKAQASKGHQNNTNTKIKPTSQDSEKAQTEKQSCTPWVSPSFLHPSVLSFVRSSVPSFQQPAAREESQKPETKQNQSPNANKRALCISHAGTHAQSTKHKAESRQKVTHQKALKTTDPNTHSHHHHPIPTQSSN